MARGAELSPEIEAVIFDFGGVMVEVYRPDRFCALEERLGLPAHSLAGILWRSPEWRLAEVGAISDEEYWRRTAARLGLTAPGDLVRFQHELWDGVGPDPRVVELVRKLKARYRTALLSNAADSLPRLLRETLGLDGLFDQVVVSALVRLAKPDPAIYRLTLDRLGTRPQATVFVDDYEPNVAAAAALGIQAVRFEGYEALLPHLRQRGMQLD